MNDTRVFKEKGRAGNRASAGRYQRQGSSDAFEGEGVLRVKGVIAGGGVSERRRLLRAAYPEQGASAKAA